MSIEINLLEYSCDSLEEEELWIIFTFSVFMFSKFCTVNTLLFTRKRRFWVENNRFAGSFKAHVFFTRTFLENYKRK